MPHCQTLLYSCEDQGAHGRFQIFLQLEVGFWDHSNADHQGVSHFSQLDTWIFLTTATIILSPVLVCWVVKKHVPGPRAGDQLWCRCTILWMSKSAPQVFHLPHLNWIWHLFHQSHRTLVWFFTAVLRATLLYSCQKHLLEGRTHTGSSAEYIQPKELSAKGFALSSFLYHFSRSMLNLFALFRVCQHSGYVKIFRCQNSFLFGKHPGWYGAWQRNCLLAKNLRNDVTWESTW